MFYLSIYIISFEILMLASFIELRHSMHPTYQYIYFFMYIFFLIFGIITFVLTIKRRKQLSFSKRELTWLNCFTYVFVLIVLLWGVVITLLDQLSYGQIIAFVTNYVCCACLLIIRPRVFVAIEALPLAVLFFLMPLFQKNDGILMGHYVNLVVVLIPITINNYNSFISFYNNMHNVMKIRQISERDELTGLYNRRKLTSYLDCEFLNSQEPIDSISILMMDVDYFKKYNDFYGHIQGDFALQSIGTILNEVSAQYDIFTARYGGEEFITVIKNLSPQQTSEIAQDIQNQVLKLQLPHAASEVSDILTVSIGQYCSTMDASLVYEMIKNADVALYEAKNRGRNQIYALT